MRVSYSALSSFNQCPLKYKWQYIDRIKVPTTPDLFFGSLVHEVLEFALKSGSLVPLEESLEYYKNNWRSDVFSSRHPEPAKDLDSSLANEAGQNDSKNKEQEAFNSGIEMIQNFYLSYKPSEVQVLSTEKFFEIYWLDHKIVGKIDRIDKLPTGEIEIIDYKTNKKLPRDDHFKYDYQLPLYAWAAQTLISNKVISNSHDSSNANDNNVTIQQCNNVSSSYPPIKLTFYYLRFNKQIDPPKAKTLEELQAYILDTISKIQSSNHQAQTSALCGWCEYLNMCSEGQEYLKTKNEKLKVKNDNSNIKSKDNSCDSCKKISGDKYNTMHSHQQSLF